MSFGSKQNKQVIIIFFNMEDTLTWLTGEGKTEITKVNDNTICELYRVIEQG